MAAQDGRDQIAAIAERSGWNAFEKPLPGILLRAAGKWPGLVLDVGANTGFYTLLAAAADKQNRVVAVEPVPAVLAMLDVNIRGNGLHDRVRLICCAVSDRNGAGRLYLPAADHGLVETSASLKADFTAVHSATMQVRERTLDRLLLRPSLIMRRVTLIKIDVEGCEARVLRGARRTIARHRPIIFVEVLYNADMPALNGFLARHGYADVTLARDGTRSVKPAIVYDETAWNHALVPNEKLEDFLAFDVPG